MIQTAIFLTWLSNYKIAKNDYIMRCNFKKKTINHFFYHTLDLCLKKVEVENIAIVNQCNGAHF